MSELKITKSDILSRSLVAQGDIAIGLGLLAIAEAIESYAEKISQVSSMTIGAVMDPQKELEE